MTKSQIKALVEMMRVWRSAGHSDEEILHRILDEVRLCGPGLAANALLQRIEALEDRVSALSQNVKYKSGGGPD